jgi:outer membrane protein
MKTATVRPLAAMLLSLGAALCKAAPAPADTSADNEIRLGLYAVFFNASAQNISGPYAPDNLNGTVKNVQTPYLAYVRTLSAHFVAELAFGIPPNTKIYGKGPAYLGSVPYDGQELSSAKWVSPTLLFNYRFLDASYALRPYVGVGINYTGFIDRDSTAAANAAFGGPTRLSLSRSLGPAATAGLSLRVASNWALYASYSYARVRTDLSADTAGILRLTRISFAPGSLVLAAGYSF